MGCLLLAKKLPNQHHFCLIFHLKRIRGSLSCSPKVSVQGFKSLWGNRVVFPRLGTGDTDRWQINLCLYATCQCPRHPISEKQGDCPKVNSDLTPWTLTLCSPDVFTKTRTSDLHKYLITDQNKSQLLFERIIGKFLKSENSFFRHNTW